MDIDSTQIIGGFSDIKFELRQRTGIEKELSQIKLWFTFEQDILCAHDFEDHSRNIILASYCERKNAWTNYIPEGRQGHHLVDYVIWKTAGVEIARVTNELFNSYRFFPVGA